MSRENQTVTIPALKLLRSRGAWAEKIHGSPMQPAVIDILACYKGHFLAFECKAPGKQPTPRQRHTIKEIQAAGGYATTVWSTDDIEMALSVVDGVEDGSIG